MSVSFRRTLVLAAVALATTLSVQAEEAAPSKSRAETFASAFEHATLGGALEATLPKAPGHLHLVEAAPARVIVDGSGQAIGYAFASAKLQYDIDPADDDVVRYDLDEIEDFGVPDPGKPLVLSGPVIWIELGGGADAGASAAAAAGDETGDLGELLARAVQPKYWEPAISYAAARLGGLHSVWVVAEIGHNRWIYYGYDDEDHTEAIYFGRPPHADEKLRGYEEWPEVDLIDSRPVGHGRQEIDPYPCEVRAIDLELTEQDDEVGKAHATIDYTFLRNAPPYLRLAFNNRDLDVVTSQRVRTIEGDLAKVTDAAGKELAFARRQSDVVVELPKAPRQGETVRLVFDYTTPLTRYSGNEYWKLGAQAWYPMAGGLHHTYATFHAKVLAKKPYVAYGTGTELERWETETHNGVELEEKRPSDFPVITGGKYFPYQIEDDHHRQIEVVSYAFKSERGQKKLAKLFADSLSVYELIYPPYPYDHVSVVEANSWGFGQAPAAFVTITKEAYNPGSTVTNRYFSQFANEIFSHEIAHGWWGHTFRVVSEEDQWLEESFAEYSSAMLLDMGRKKDDLDRMSKTWHSYAKDVKPGLPIVAANRLAGEDAGRVRTYLLYDKGPWVLHCLRSELGDKTFYTLLKSFLRSFDGKVARTEDFRGLLEFLTKKDWKPWFDRYVYGPELPELKKD